MIEDIVLNTLGDSLGLPVFAEIPKNYPSEFYVIEKTGSSQVNHIRRATVAIQSYSTGSKYTAASMNDEVIEAMLSKVVMLPEIARVELNSDYDYTDTTQKIYRYQAVFDITYY